MSDAMDPRHADPERWGASHRQKPVMAKMTISMKIKHADGTSEIKCPNATSEQVEAAMDFMDRLSFGLGFAGAEIKKLEAEVETWKKRAEQHGCNVDEGDSECG